jgi:hypothetical protein
MSEMAPEGGGEGGGGMRIFGMPWFVIVGIAGLAAYFLFFRGSGSSGGGSSSGGGGTVTSSGTTTLNKGAVSVTVTQSGNPQPQPPTKTRTSSQSITVPNVVGERANAGIEALQDAGLGYKSTTGPRDKSKTYDVASQQPTAGAKVKKNSVVDIGFKPSEA